jgi:hypothetical protein
MRAKTRLKSITDDPESLRLHTQRLTEDRKVTTVSQAASFVAEVGIARLLTNGADGFPSLFAAVCGRPFPAIPKHSHEDEEMSLAWHLKDSLIEIGVVYYSKLIAGQPTFAAVELIPSLVKLYAKSIRTLSEPAQKIHKALIKRSPQITRELKETSGLSVRKMFDDAIAELQSTMIVVPTEVRYEPTFGYVWGLAVDRFPQIKEKTKEDPVKEILRWHLRAVRIATNKDLVKRFKFPLDAVNKALKALESNGEISVVIDGALITATASADKLPIRNIAIKTGWD